MAVRCGRLMGILWSSPITPPIRHCSSFVRDAYINIQQQSSSIPMEQPLYSELRVRQWLQGFQGGKVHVEKCAETGVATVILDNPDKKNALSGDMMVQLSDVICDLEAWSNGRLLLLRGAGGQFCSGADFDFVRQIADPLSGSKMCIFMQGVTGRLHRLHMISFALVEGHALGGGAEIASACDFRLFNSTANIGFVHGRLGVNTGWGGGTHLTRVVGPRVALRLMASGNAIDANEALRCGLADEVIEAMDTAEMTAKVNGYVKPFLETSSNAAKGSKRIVINADQCSFGESMNRERDVFTQNWGSPAHLNALKNLK